MKDETAASFDRGIDAAGLGGTLTAAAREILYSELKSAARRQLRAIGAPATLQTTAVVHEAWVRLRDGEAFRNHAHFMASAALAMRYVIIDYIRSATAEKRTPDRIDTSTDTGMFPDAKQPSHAEILDVHAALEDLAKLKPRCVRVVECRYFAGYTESETASALEVTERTVNRDWTFARAWLRTRLEDALAPTVTHTQANL